MRKLRLGKGSGPCSRSEGKVLVGLGLQARLLLSSNAVHSWAGSHPWLQTTVLSKPRSSPSCSGDTGQGCGGQTHFLGLLSQVKEARQSCCWEKSTAKTETRATRRAEQLTSRNWKKGGGVVAFAPFLFECHLDISMKIREYATKPLGARVLNSEFNTAIQNVLVWVCGNERTIGNTSLFLIPPAHTSITGDHQEESSPGNSGDPSEGHTHASHPCKISSGLLHGGQMF